MNDPNRQRAFHPALFERLLDAAPGALLVLEEDGNVCFVSLEAQKFFGYERAELIGRQVEVLLPERFRHRHVGLRSAFLSNPRVRPMGVGVELFGLRKDGSEVPVQIQLSPLFTEDGLLVLCAVRDGSDRARAPEELDPERRVERDIRRRLELHARELERSNEALDTFAHVASHDLRSPLRDVANLATWIREDTAELLPPASKKHLEKLVERVRRMEALLDGLLQYSRAGRVHGDVRTLFARVLAAKAAGEVAVPEGFEIAFTGGDFEITAPVTPLSQVIRNLIDNALKHHDRDRGRVDVAISLEEDHVRFRVADDGLGIATEHHDRVFRMFQRLGSHDSTGTGIGLALVKKVVESYGGTITIEPNEPRGVAFTFTWPKRFTPTRDSPE